METKSYKLWQILTAFVLGALVVGGVFMVSGSSLLGLSRLPSAPSTGCTYDEQMAALRDDLVRSVIDSRQELVRLLHPFSGQLHEFLTEDYVIQINQIANNNAYSYANWAVNRLANPSTGMLTIKIRDVGADLGSHVSYLQSTMVRLLHPQTGTLGTRLNSLDTGIKKILDMVGLL